MKGSAEVKRGWHTCAGDRISRYQTFCDDMPCKVRGKEINDIISDPNFELGLTYHSTRCRMAAFQFGSVGILDRPIV